MKIHDNPILENVLSFLEPQEVLRLCQTNKIIYNSMEEYLLKSLSTDDFKVLDSGSYSLNSLIDYKKILGVGDVYIYISSDIYYKKLHIKNVNIIVAGRVTIELSNLSFEDCTFDKSDILTYDAFDIQDSQMEFHFCYVSMFKHTFLKIENQSCVLFSNTIFEKVDVPIVSRFGQIIIENCKFINCNTCLDVKNMFRIILRETHFLNCKNSMYAETMFSGVFIEIGSCVFENSCQPFLHIPPRKSSLDLYSNIYVS